MEVNLLERRERAVVVRGSGALVHDTAGRFQQAAWDLLEPGDRNLVLELSEVEFWDSSAFRALIGLAHHVGREGGHLVVTGNPRMGHMVERAGLSELILTASDVEAGVAVASAPSV